MGQSIIKNPRKIWSQPGGGGDTTAIETRLTVLEDNEYKVTYWEAISSDSGTITKPTNSTILLDQFQEGADAFITTIVNGKPSGEAVMDSGGNELDVTSFDALGNYTLSGVPSGYPVALIYVISIKAVDYQNIDLDFEISRYDMVQQKIITTISSSATPTIVISDDNKITDVLVITALATGATFAISGTPTDDKAIIFYIRDNGTARTLTFGSGTFTVIGTPNPTTTVINKWLAVGARWNATMSRWFILAVNQEA